MKNVHVKIRDITLIASDKPRASLFVGDVSFTVDYGKMKKITEFWSRNSLKIFQTNPPPPKNPNSNSYHEVNNGFDQFVNVPHLIKTTRNKKNNYWESELSRVRWQKVVFECSSGTCFEPELQNCVLGVFFKSERQLIAKLEDFQRTKPSQDHVVIWRRMHNT